MINEVGIWDVLAAEMFSDGRSAALQVEGWGNRNCGMQLQAL